MGNQLKKMNVNSGHWKIKINRPDKEQDDNDNKPRKYLKR